MIVVMMIKEGFSASCTDCFFLCIRFVTSRRNTSYLTRFLFVYISASRMYRSVPHPWRAVVLGKHRSVKSAIAYLMFQREAVCILIVSDQAGIFTGATRGAVRLNMRDEYLK
jgi:hypothetical protein